MRKLLLSISILSLFLLSACPEKPQKITGRDIIYISSVDVQYFLNVLPDILVFVRQYQSGLSREDMESADYNENYFQALIKQDKLMKKILASGFENTDHFLDVYISVFMAYELQPENTSNFDQNMNDFRISIKRQMQEVEELQKSTLEEYEQKILSEKKKTLENQKKLFANIYFLQPYMPQIQAILQESQ